MISIARPFVKIFFTRGKQTHYSGHIINYKMDLNNFALKLPLIPSKCGIILVKRRNETHQIEDLKIRK